MKRGVYLSDYFSPGARHCYEEIDEDENCDILPEGAEEKLKEFETDVNLYRDRKDSREEPVNL